MTTTNVLFRVYCETSYGQTVHVVGNTPALGNWMPTNDNKLKWSQLNWWETAQAINYQQQELNINSSLRINQEAYIGKMATIEFWKIMAT